MLRALFKPWVSEPIRIRKRDVPLGWGLCGILQCTSLHRNFLKVDEWPSVEKKIFLCPTYSITGVIELGGQHSNSVLPVPTNCAALASKMFLSNSLYLTCTLTHSKVCLNRCRSGEEHELTTCGWLQYQAYRTPMPTFYPTVLLLCQTS